MALAAFARNKIYLFSLSIARGASGVDIRIPHVAVLGSDSLIQPHGCAFLDEDHLIVCNRGGDVCLFRIPAPEDFPGEVRVRPLASICGQGFLRAVVKTPGSAAAYQDGPNCFRVFVCSDQWHFVTAHTISLGDDLHVVNEGILIENALQIPDGIALSPDHRWIAISNHVGGEAIVFENAPGLNRKTAPAARLGGIICPHGLSFDARGHLYVADASSPYLHVFEKPENGWESRTQPSRSVRLLSNDMFYTGRYGSREGGVKGIHVDREADVIMATHKLGILEFYDLPSLWHGASEVDSGQMEELRRERDAEIARSKSAVLRRRWTLLMRLRKEIPPLKGRLRNKARRIGPKLQTIRLKRINEGSKDSLLDLAGPVVCLTSHSERLPSVYLVIESIGRGTLKPKRLILWLSEGESPDTLPDSLVRQQSRGLEIRYTRDLGPHTKYYSFLENGEPLTTPLVTADDDVFYPRDWLEGLVRAHESNPEVIHSYRARRMRLNRYHFEPYSSWLPCTSSEPDRLNFLIAVEGVIYPPAFLHALKARGTAFEETCPQADDIWLNYVAHREGFAVAQVAAVWPSYSLIPGTQVTRLSSYNVEHGGNQLQLARTYSPEDRAALYAYQEGDAKIVRS